MNEQSRTGAQPRSHSQDGHVLNPNEAAKPRIELDAAASAALAQAVTGARQGGARAEDRRTDEWLETPSATVPSPDNGAKSSRARPMGPAVHALVVIAALAAGAGGAQILQSLSRSGPATPWAEMAQVLRQNQDQAIGLAGDMKALRTEIDAIRRSLEQSDADMARHQAGVGERFERSATASDALAQDTAVKLARLGEKLDRLEAGSTDTASGFNAVIGRLERIEDRIAATTVRATPMSSPAVRASEAASTESPALTGSLTQQAPAKDATVDGWVLHEVHNGTALIESRNGRLVDVAQGEMVPGVGRVEAIERRGKRWVVVTPKGVIGTMR
jgi:hypothetical protein